jgi:hypothetical protein
VKICLSSIWILEVLLDLEARAPPALSYKFVVILGNYLEKKLTLTSQSVPKPPYVLSQSSNPIMHQMISKLHINPSRMRFKVELYVTHFRL